MQTPAGKVGVFALEAMDDTRFQKGVKRPVNRDGRQTRALFGQPVENFVGADARQCRSNFLVDFAAQVREAYIFFGENLGGAFDRGFQPLF